MFFQVNHNMLLARNFIQKSQIVLLSGSLDRQSTSKMKTLLDLWEYYQTTIKPKKTTQHLKFNLPRHQIFSSFFWILKESNKRHWLSFGGLLSLSLSNDTSMVENYSTARHLRQYHSWHQPQPPILAFNENLNLELYLQ